MISLSEAIKALSASLIDQPNFINSSTLLLSTCIGNDSDDTDDDGNESDDEGADSDGNNSDDDVSDDDNSDDSDDEGTDVDDVRLDAPGSAMISKPIAVSFFRRIILLLLLLSL